MAITYTRDDLIKRSFRLLGVTAPGETPSATEINDAALTLNLMIREWRAREKALWQKGDGVLFFATGTASYDLGSTGDHATASHIKTEVATAAASGAVSMVLDSTSGITAADKIGVELDDGTLQWAVVSSVDNTTEVTIDTGLTDTAAVDNNIFTYTTILPRPYTISNPRVKRDDDYEIPITMVGRDDYYSLPDKDSTGVPVQIYYDAQEPNSKVHLWPVPDDVGDRLYFTFDAEFDEFSASGDGVDMPKEWWNVLTYGLATEIAPEYGVDPNRLMLIEAKLAAKLRELRGQDRGKTPVRFEV